MARASTLATVLFLGLAACGGSSSTGTDGGPDGGGGPGSDAGNGGGLTSHALFVATGCKYQVVDLSTNAINSQVDGCALSGGSGMTGLAANATAKKVYATWTGGPVAYFDAATDAVLGSTSTAQVAGAYENLVVSADGSTGYAVDSSGPIDIITFNGGSTAMSGTLSNGYQVTGSTATTVAPTELALDTGRNRLYAMVYFQSGRRIEVWDTVGKTVVQTIPWPTSAGLDFDVALNPTTHKLYFHVGDLGSSFHQGIVAVDLTAGSVGTPVDYGVNDGISQEGTLAVDTQTNKVYALDEGGAKVFVLDGATNAITGTIPLNVTQATTIVVNEATHTAYVTTNGTSVLAVNLQTLAVSTPITLPSSAAQRLGMAILP